MLDKENWYFLNQLCLYHAMLLVKVTLKSIKSCHNLFLLFKMLLLMNARGRYMTRQKASVTANLLLYSEHFAILLSNI